MDDAPAERMDLGRAVRAFLASVVTGLIVYWMVIVAALPRVAERLSAGDRAWLREAFRAHPIGVVLSILATALVLALPVPIVFRLVYGPMPLAVRRWPRAPEPRRTDRLGDDRGAGR